MTFFPLVIDHKFRIFPLFSLFHFPPLSRKLLFPPYFEKFSPTFQKIHLLLRTLCVFRFPTTLPMMHLCITQCTHCRQLHTFVLFIYFLKYLYSSPAG